ncbi:hypothetical protein [Streptomyces coelicoflavus]|uniref:hypothetical protein n=1 Tax=Streptomyces coelicoflavus TaxID=285562 RepID=UPI0036CB5E67
MDSESERGVYLLERVQGSASLGCQLQDLPPSSRPQTAGDRERAELEAGDIEAAGRADVEDRTSPNAPDVPR